MEAAKLEAQKIKALADAEAYAKQKIMAADGALEKKLQTYEEVQRMWATAFQNYQGALVPTFQNSGSAANGKGNAGIDFMQIMGAKAAMDLNMDLQVKK